MTSATVHSETNDGAMQEEAASALANLQVKNESISSEFKIPQRFTKSGRKKAVPFPLKLMKVLSNKDFEHIITWMPSGKSFSIVEPKEFVSEILPGHFKSAKYASFTRKLHRWGFMRHYRGEEAGAFYHKLFQKDRLDLVEQMTCHKEPLASQAAKKQQQNQQLSEAPKVSDVAPLPAVQSSAQSLIAGSLQQRMNVPTLGQDALAQLQQLNMSGLRQEPTIGAAERLHAAIELEVARRVMKERIEAAAVSRQLALINQLNPAQQQAATSNMPWNTMNGASIQAQLLLRQQQQHQEQQLSLMAQFASKGLKQQLGLDGPFGVAMETKGLDKLPTINMQNAKTA